jgi:hypothetical protein
MTISSEAKGVAENGSEGGDDAPSRRESSLPDGFLHSEAVFKRPW